LILWVNSVTLNRTYRIIVALGFVISILDHELFVESIDELKSTADLFSFVLILIIE
jgi:hypothetical protein